MPRSTHIVVDDGRAVGVRLSDGTELTARKLVASTVDVEQTFLKFLDPKDVSEELRERVATKVRHQDWSLFSVHLAMREAPQYTAASSRSRRRPGVGREPGVRIA